MTHSYVVLVNMLSVEISSSEVTSVILSFSLHVSSLKLLDSF